MAHTRYTLSINTITLALVFAHVLAMGQTPEKLTIEKEYLARAKKNIELYRKGDVILNLVYKDGKPVKKASIKINQTSQDFLFGALSEEFFSPRMDSAQGSDFKALFKDLFNFTILTFKWQPYEPEQGKIAWAKHINALAWYKQNNITVKGHTLGWTHQAGTPRWLLKLPPGMATDLYKARIYNIVSGYKSQINIWDVVNEPVTTIPWEKALQDTAKSKAGIDEGIRYNVSNITLEQTIPWVENSYRWAQEANPDGNFILNDFYLIAKPDVREKFFRLMQELQKRKVPVKGIGIQAHEPREMWFSPVEFYKTLDLYATLNVPIHITEFIPQSSGKDITGWREGTWTEEAQADFAEQFYTLAFGHPSIVSFNWWGFSDRTIWLPGGGLLDKNNNPKPVYTRLKKLIKEDWMTKNLHIVANKKGEVNFRGFFGNYDVQIKTIDGEEHAFTLHIKERKNNTVTFTLP